MSGKQWVKTDRVNDVVKALGSLVKTDVLVGIPESETERENQAEPNNATLAYIHEHGSPAQNIPARAFLIPGVRGAEKEYRPRLIKAAQLALDGKAKDALKQMDAAGLIAEMAAKTKINSGDFVPLSEATLRARAARGRKGAAAELARRESGLPAGTDLAKPLIDTGQLRNSITHIIRGKK